MSVASAQRFTRRTTDCPVCGGNKDMPQGQGKRCYGFLSEDERYAHCTREEYAESIEPGKDGTYAHRLDGPCRCGQDHTGDVLTIVAKAGQNGHSPSKRPKPVRNNAVTRRFHLYDPDGKLAGVHVRQDFTDAEGQPDKDMRWEQHNGRGSQDMPLYDLKRLKSRPCGTRVYLVEGELKCDRLNEALQSAGVDAIAVATVTGAGTIPCDAALRELIDYRVALWRDNDEPGRGHMLAIARWLRERGERPQWADWPDAPPAGDAADFLRLGGKVTDLESLVGDVPDAEAETGPKGKASDHKEGDRSKNEQAKSGPKAGHNFDWRSHDQTASALREKHIVRRPDIVPGILPFGYSMLGGRPKEGKTTLALQVAIAVASEAETVLGGLIPAHGDVFMLNLEESELRMQRRIGQMRGKDSAWPDRLHLYYQWPDLQRGGLDALDEVAEAYPDLKLVILDPFALFRGRANIHASYELDYQDSARLGAWVNKRKVSILVVTHTHQEAGEEPINLIQGTTGIVGPVDNVLVLVRQQGVMTLLRKGRDFEKDDPIRLRGNPETLIWTPDNALEAKPARTVALEALELMTDVWASPKALADFGGIPQDTMRQTLHRLLKEQPSPVKVNGSNHYALVSRLAEKKGA